MVTAPLVFLLGIGAVFVLSDLFSSSNSDDTPPEVDADDATQNTDDDSPDAATPDDEARAAPVLVEGTPGDDVIFSPGGEILRGFAGNDTLITDGNSTLRGGAGDDTLISIGGDAFLRGGTGEDTFVILPVGVSEEGDLLDRSGAPVAPSVIVDFNPDEDQLVLDLRQFDLGDTGTTENPVILTGVPGPGDGGVLIRVNGIDVVQLSSYGSGDAQSGLVALATDFDALEVIGAVYAFPEADDQEPDTDDDLTPQAPGDDADPVDLSLPDGVFVSTLFDTTLEVQIVDIVPGTVLTAEQITAAFGDAVRAEEVMLSFTTATEGGFGSPVGGTEVALSEDGTVALRLPGQHLMTVEAAISRFSFDGSPGDLILDARDGPVQELTFGNSVFVSPLTVIGGPGTNVISLGDNEGLAFSRGTVVGGEGPNIVTFWAGFAGGYAFEVGPSTNTVLTYANTAITAGAGPVDITIPHDEFLLNFGPTVIAGFNPETDTLTIQAQIDPFEGLEFRDSDAGLIVENDSTGQSIAVLQGFTTADVVELSLTFVPSDGGLAA